MLAERFPQITSLQYIVNTKFNDSYGDLDVVTYRGSDHIEECMEGYQGSRNLHFIINPKSFYQTNSAQAQRLYSFVAELAELQAGDTLYDLYTGTGTIALFLADKCRRVVGIEYVEEAIADAKANARATASTTPASMPATWRRYSPKSSSPPTAGPTWWSPTLPVPACTRKSSHSSSPRRHAR